MKDRVRHQSKTRLLSHFFVITVGILLFKNSISAQGSCTPPSDYYVIDNKKRSEIPTSDLNTNINLYISGTFTVDGFLSLKNKKIVMAPGARIVVPALPKAGNINLQITGCEIKGCNGNMWEGITIYERSVLTFSNNRIEDAYHAIKVLGGDDVANKAFLQNVIGNTFHRNYIGIWFEKWFAIVGVAWLNTPPYLVDNVFSTDGKPLAKGYFVEDSNYAIGIYGIGGREVIQLGKTENAGKQYPKNTFENLGHGIYLTSCDSSIVSIENNSFNNCKTFGVILYNTGDVPAKISNCQFSNSGVGLSIENSPAIIKKCSFKNILADTVNHVGGEAMILGNNYFKTYDIEFTNCDAGIVMNGDGEISTCQFHDVRVGIGINPIPKGNIKIFDNRLNCTQHGITVGSSVPVELVEVHDNKITIDNKGENLLSNGFSKNTTAFWFDGLTENLKEANYYFHHNDIFMNRANYGLYMLASSGVNFSHNTIQALQNEPNGENGIYLGGATNNLIAANQMTVDTNTVEDPILYFGLNGITLFESPSNTIACNDIYTFGNAMLVSGDCDRSTLKGNRFFGGVNGLSFDQTGVIGAQNETGNQWLGSFSNYPVTHSGDEETVKKSLFTVGKSNVTSYLPTSIYLNAAISMFTETTNENWNNCEGEYGRSRQFNLNDDNDLSGLSTVKEFSNLTDNDLIPTGFVYDATTERALETILERNEENKSEQISALGVPFRNLRKFQENNRQVFLSGLEQFKSQNSNSSTPKEITAKRVLDIYANAVLQKKLQDKEAQELQSIAALCPHEYGWSVFAAQSVYHQFTGKTLAVASKNCQVQKEQTSISTKKFSAYPNPANDVITIESNYLTPTTEIVLMDITGKVVKQFIAGTEKVLNVSTSGLQNGMYIVSLKSNNSTQTQKLMIQHQ